MENENSLPEITINGRPWLIDAEGYRIVDKLLPSRCIQAYEMQYLDTGYRFLMDKDWNRIASPYDGNRETVIVNLEHFTEMDPQRVALKYGLPIDQVVGRPDYEIMEDQQVLIDRLRGRLTTVDIDGQTFYIDFPMEMLRAKDNFLSEGIPFNVLDDYFNDETGNYDVSYNKRLQQWESIDCTDLVRQPKDIIIVSFPPPWELDPVGFARSKDIPLQNALEDHTQQAHYKAKLLTGKDSWLDYIIDDNRERMGYTKRPQKRNSRLGSKA